MPVARSFDIVLKRCEKNKSEEKTLSLPYESDEFLESMESDWEIIEWDTNWQTLDLEFWKPQDIVDYADVLSSLSSDDEQEAYGLICSYEGEVLSETQFENSYYGKFNDREEFTKDFYSDDNQIPNWLDSYVDWEALWDGELSDNFLDLDGSGYYTFIFRKDW